MSKPTSFAEILREKMAKSHSFTERETNTNSQKNRQFSSESVAFHSEKNTYIDFSSFCLTLKNDVFRSEKRDFTNYESEKAKYPEPPPPPRAWSESQKIALKSLISLGASELTDRSTDQQIKKAFRRLAKSLHPDLNKSSQQGQAFIKLHACYKTLIKK